MRVGVVLNPVAGGGRLAKSRAELEAALARYFDHWEIRETSASGNGEELARLFALDGADVVIAAGGDGTASEVVDGLTLYRSEYGTAPAFALLPCGTGTDFARGLQVSRDIAATLGRIAAAPARAIDIGRVSYVDESGAEARRNFLNISSLGLSGPVTRAVNQQRNKGKGSAKLLFLWRTVVEFSRYRFQNIRFSVDGGPPEEAQVALAAVCNGRFFGGGMMIAPDAAIDDGQFDVVVVRASGKLGLLRDLRLLYSGRHRNHHAISILRGARIAIEPVGDAGAGGLQLEADGEPLGRAPALFEILPRALTLKM